MLTKLGNIAEIKSGHSFRKGLQHVDTGNTYIVQAKNVQKHGDISDLNELEKIDFNPKSKDTFLSFNDVLLISRNSNSGEFRSCVLKIRDKNVVASNTLCVLKVIDKNILPEYISMYLNSKEFQKDIGKIISGGSIKTIYTKQLQNFNIPIPPLITQQNLVKLNQNIYKQEKINQIKKELRDKIISQTFTDIVNKNK